MPSAPFLAWLMVTALAVASCAAPSEDVCRVQRVRSLLINGYERTDYLGIDEAAASAIVALELTRADGNRDLCSGVIVGPDTVLTAKHCFEEEARELRLSGRVWRSRGEGPLAVDRHPLRDVALAHLPGLDAATSLALSVEDAGSLRGRFVEVAGAGVTEDGRSGHTALAVVEVLSVDGPHLVVRMPQPGGPCGGDSGGPLLVRGPSGRVDVAGVLSVGAPDCNGPDRYERVDELRSWLSERVVGVTGSAACGRIERQGRCFGARVVWCEAGEVVAMDCDDGARCGWSIPAGRFECVTPETDPCAGVHDTGACFDGAAVRCVEGHLERLDCAACGASCQVSSRTGRATCASPAD